MPKTPTEIINLEDVWNGFKTTYLPFVEWMSNPDNEESFVLVEFVENAPTPYVNKWSREQFKIKVLQNEETKQLSGGKKLFAAIREYCLKVNKLPIDIGKLQIIRWGNGFDTNYKVVIPQKK